MKIKIKRARNTAHVKALYSIPRTISSENAIAAIYLLVIFPIARETKLHFQLKR